MRKNSFLSVVATIAFACTSPVFAVSPDLAEATELLKQMHADECQKQKLRGQLLVAHQAHDQAKMNALYPQLEAINNRLKPSENKLNALKVNLKKNREDQNAFETVQLQMGECD